MKEELGSSDDEDKEESAEERVKTPEEHK